MARFCKKCNSPIDEGGNFCTQCGSNEIYDDSPAAATPIEATPIVSNPGLGSPVAPFIPPSTEPPKSTFGDLPDFMSDSVSNTNVPETVPVPGMPPTPSMLPNATTPVAVNAQASGEQTLFKEEKKPKKNSNAIVFIILGIVGAILFIAGAITIIFSGDKGNNITNGTPGHSPSTESSFFNEQNSIRVGTSEFGYVSVPKNWVKFVDVNGSDTLQYTDSGLWIVTLYSLPAKNRGAKEWANYVYSRLEENGASNIDVHTTVINDYSAFEVDGYYEADNIYLSTWFFEDSKGTTHYIALEGPSNTGDNYNIVFSFNENK